MTLDSTLFADAPEEKKTGQLRVNKIDGDALLHPTDPVTFHSQAGRGHTHLCSLRSSLCCVQLRSSLDADGRNLPVSQWADGGSDARRAVSHPLLSLPSPRLRDMQAAVTASGVSDDL